MANRNPNHRLLKFRRTYSVDEIAVVLRVHANTVRAWHQAGLQPVDDARPILFRGDVVVAFLRRRRSSRKRPCGPGRLYCLPCRAPRAPAGGMLDYVPSSAGGGSLSGLCPACASLMYRRVAHGRISEVAAGIEVRFPNALPRLGVSSTPFVNSEIGQAGLVL
jgi:hypothetical protein